MGKIKVELTEEEVLKIVDIVKEKGTQLVNMKSDIENTANVELVKSITNYLSYDIDLCSKVVDRLLYSVNRGV